MVAETRDQQGKPVKCYEPSSTTTLGTDILKDVFAAMHKDIVLFRRDCMQLAFSRTETDACELHGSLYEREEDLRGHFNLAQLIVLRHRSMDTLQPYVFRLESLRTTYEALRIVAEAAERKRSRLHGVNRCARCNIYASEQYSPLRDDNVGFIEYLHICDELASLPAGAKADRLYMRLQDGDLQRLNRKLERTRRSFSQKTMTDADQDRWKSRYNYLTLTCGILHAEWERAQERRKSPFHDLNQEIDARIDELKALGPPQLAKHEQMLMTVRDERHDSPQPSAVVSTISNLPQRWHGRTAVDRMLTDRDRRWRRTAQRSPLFKVEAI